MADDFTARYAGLLAGSYDCMDRIVLNAYYPVHGGRVPDLVATADRGGDAETDAVLDNAHLMPSADRRTSHTIAGARETKTRNTPAHQMGAQVLLRDQAPPPPPAAGGPH